MKGILHPADIPTYSKEDHRTLEALRREAQKNPFIPGARIIRRADARSMYCAEAGCRQWLYPLSEVNDFGFFAYIEKDAASDTDRPWANQAHPDATLYVLILTGGGSVILGEGSPLFHTESYTFEQRDIVVIPRGVPYKFTGGWTGVCMHARSNVFGRPVGEGRYSHPVVTLEKPSRPTAEETAQLREVGSYICTDPTMAFGVKMPPHPMSCPWVADTHSLLQANALYGSVTPTDLQTQDAASLAQMRQNPSVLGARVLRRKELDDLYNSNAAGAVSLYPTSWTDDMAIFATLIHDEKDDAVRPFDSHSHLDIEEYKYILSGSGWIQFGVGDDAFETESYEFHAGDLVINPRSVPHYEGGTYESISIHTRMSVFGKVPGTAAFPHIAYVYTQPPRPTEAERQATNAPGTYIFMDSRERFNMLAPDPFLRVERNPIDMTHLRPDLFEQL